MSYSNRSALPLRRSALRTFEKVTENSVEARPPYGTGPSRVETSMPEFVE